VGSSAAVPVGGAWSGSDEPPQATAKTIAGAARIKQRMVVMVQAHPTASYPEPPCWWWAARTAMTYFWDSRASASAACEQRRLARPGG
jgi:hypothetical protein